LEFTFGKTVFGFFEDFFHPFLEGGGHVCVKAIPSTAAAVNQKMVKK
jgi:hypothetical protein